jgi:predicted glutamine amidotransferase
MCRLYCLRSSQRNKVECELIEAQNSLLRQSQGDAQGQVHADGWGLGHYQAGQPELVRQAQAAVASEQYRWTAAHAFTTNAIAHVRHATIGARQAGNTHPFQWGRWLFAHNGTLGAFGAIRQRMLGAMTPQMRAQPRGDTDSEHVFHYLLSRWQREPARPLASTVREAVTDVINWSHETSPVAEAALNLVLTDGEQSLVLRRGRSLWRVERTGVHPCQVCGGALHVEGAPQADYRAVVFASEPITTDEDWVEVADGSLFTVDAQLRLQVESLS